jgi:deoxynucleoside triphosphate triphosphohydrolase SAMHD1
MIEFDWRAMRLIDSPIIQRLRYIKQLGFSYLTYPSAEHSRFSHSIGIGHVVSNFINAINKRANEADTTAG